MATEKDIYNVIKKLMPENVTTSHVPISGATIGTAQNATVKTLKNHCYISTRPTRNALRDLDGAYVTEFLGVTLNLYTGQTEEDLDQGYLWAKSIEKKMDSLINVSYPLTDNENLWIQDTHRLQGIERFFDKNGTAVFVINYEISYS